MNQYNKSFNFNEIYGKIPTSPGCYLWKDNNNEVIYVGKAKNLQNRMRQYFQKTLSPKTRILVENIYNYDFILTNNERDSLLLEINLINKYEPKYNIKLRQNRKYPYIKLTSKPYLKLSSSYNYQKKEGVYYFGPFSHGYNPYKIIEILESVFSIKKCENPRKNKPCINYQLGKCIGYCMNNVSDALVKDIIKNIRKIFQGDVNSIISLLKEEINTHLNNMSYEEAEKLTQSIKILSLYKEKQSVVFNNNENVDFINYYYKNNIISISLSYVRYGKLIKTRNFMFRYYSINVIEFMETFIQNYYQKNYIPNKIYLDFETNLSEVLNSKFIIPLKGRKLKLLNLAKESAKIKFDLNEEIFELKLKFKDKTIDNLKKILNLKSTKLIEMIDISNKGQKDNVGVVISYKNNQPNKSGYRKFDIEKNSINDYENTYNVTYRHFKRKLINNETMPDIYFVDGKYQINYALNAIDELNIKNISVFGLVKDENHKTSYIFDSTNKRIDLENYQDVLVYLSEIQNEVHRFAINYHNFKHKKRLKLS